MSTNRTFSYTRRDYEQARQEGLSKLPSLSQGKWTDLNASDPGIVLLDYVHALVDMVQFYQDHQALEAFLSTAKERKNIFRLAKQLSYKVRSAKGALVDVTFYVEQPYSATIRIPKDTAVSTEKSLTYVTREDSYLLAGESSVTVPCVQGIYAMENYVGTGISRYSNGDESDDQVYTLEMENIDIDTIRIKDSTGRVWERVDYIIFSGPNDYVYQVDLTYEGKVNILFGNGERGVIPQTSDLLNITYLYNAGEEGRVGSLTLNRLVDPLFDVNMNRVSLKVRNDSASIGGSSVESDEEITEKAPGAIKSQDRAVTLNDFESLAKRVDGVASAVAYDINRAPTLCLHHEVKVVVLPSEGATATQSLLDNVYEYLYSRMLPPTTLYVISPVEVPIDINITVLKNPSYLEGGVEYEVLEAIRTYFNSRSNSLGEAFSPNDIIAAVTALSCIRSVQSMTPSSLVDINIISIARLGSVNITIN